MAINIKNCGRATNTKLYTATNYTLIQRLQCQIDKLNVSGGTINEFYKIIETVDDLPTPQGNEIQLEDNVTYYFITDVDLEGAYINCAKDNVLLGFSSENCSLTSTGIDPSTYLINSEDTLVIRHMAFNDVPKCFNIDGTSGGDIALDWTGVNINGVPEIGIFKTIANLILNKCAFTNSKGLTIDGTYGSFVMVDTLMAGDGLAGDLITIEPTANITRRIRVEDSAIVLFGLTDGFNVSTGATIATETYILSFVNFTNSGSGTSVLGVDYSFDQSLFTNCAGIINSAKFAQYSINNNALVTNIVAVDSPVILNTTSIANPLNQKFTVNGNRATYISGKEGFFEVEATLSVLSANNNRQFSFYVAKNGVVITSSLTTVTTNGSNRAESVNIFAPVLLNENDYIEIWVENNTDNSDITLISMNVMVSNISL